ncbi:hypothetical protein GGS23DRAFT_367624 [Durotheca rogersii]|uniref:uncharacterized protein n=1 Tax=Durotheca rogersii TaxID=419775 RepID=UPI00221F1DAB|nr:uncharacterized protein GGS23DRAFT_367624 [Durotheca rogersii]KAI5866083.1 hypothetical protein GGS23DRAFT_367624 [Durotheca rogersii]
MASRRLFDPVTLLRVAPLLTSTATLVHAGDAHLFLSTLVGLRPQRPKVNELAPRYFESFFWRGLPLIFLGYGASVALGVANYVALRRAASVSAWYAGGSVLALAHFAFVPKIMWRVKDAIDADEAPDGPGAQAIQRWLNVHYARMALADFPAWTCFFVAALKVLKPI